MHPVSFINVHHDVIDLVNQEMVKTSKPWISWEPTTTFLRNKKICNLCLRWHILRSYRLVAEVTFNTGRNLSLPLETVTNTVKHEKKCSFCQTPEYLHVVNYSAVAQLRGIKLRYLNQKLVFQELYTCTF